CNIERVAERMLGQAGAGLVVLRAAGIGGNLLDRDDGRAEPGHRGGLHGVAQPALDGCRHRAVEGGGRSQRDAAIGKRRYLKGPVDATGTAAIDALGALNPRRFAYRTRHHAGTLFLVAPLSAALTVAKEGKGAAGERKRYTDG